MPPGIKCLTLLHACKHAITGSIREAVAAAKMWVCHSPFNKDKLGCKSQVS